MAIWKRNRKRGRGFVWMGDYTDAVGRRHRMSGATKDEVDRKRAEKMAECGVSPELRGDPDLTVDQFAQQWLKRLETSDELKPRTVESYAQLYACHVASAFGPIRLRELRRVHVKEFLAAKRTEVIKGSKKGKTLSKNTVRLIRACLLTMLNEALDDEVIKSNPAAEPKRPRGRKRNRAASPAIRPFSDQELAQVLEAARLHAAEYHPLFLLLARTGLRPGEAFALQWPDLDFTKRKILVERGFTKGMLGSTKTNSIRTVDMSSELAVALSALYRVREAQTLKSGWGELPEFVFVNAAAQPLDESRVRKVFKRVMKKAGISGHTLYDCRHTFATALLAKGVPITYVAAQLGHAKPTTTLQWYAHWLPQADAGFVDRLDAAGSTWHRFGTDSETGGEPDLPDADKLANLKEFFGAPSETRTPDPLIKSSQLSSMTFQSSRNPWTFTSMTAHGIHDIVWASAVRRAVTKFLEPTIAR